MSTATYRGFGPFCLPCRPGILSPFAIAWPWRGGWLPGVAARNLLFCFARFPDWVYQGFRDGSGPARLVKFDICHCWSTPNKSIMSFGLANPPGCASGWLQARVRFGGRRWVEWLVRCAVRLPFQPRMQCRRGSLYHTLPFGFDNRDKALACVPPAHTLIAVAAPFSKLPIAFR